MCKSYRKRWKLKSISQNWIVHRNPWDIIVFRILTGAATFARSIRAFNVGDGGSIERLDNGGSFFGKPISRGSPNSFQRARAARRIFEGIMSAGVLSESDKDGDRRDAARVAFPDLILDGWLWLIIAPRRRIAVIGYEVLAVPFRFRKSRRNCLPRSFFYSFSSFSNSPFIIFVSKEATFSHVLQRPVDIWPCFLRSCFSNQLFFAFQFRRTHVE